MDEDSAPRGAASRVVDVPWFCRNARVPEDAVRALIEAGRLRGGVVDDDGHALGIRFDALPTADELAELGHAVDDFYSHERLHSFEDDEGPSWPGEPTWTMSWGGEG